jgi:hypothetical protein
MFQLHRTGTTRLTMCIGRVAIKVARSRIGVRCNRFEAELWRRTTETRRAILCPVLSRLPFDTAIVMRRAVPLTRAEAADLREKDAFPDWHYDPSTGEREPFEYKESDWGWLDGRLVAIDYSAPAL